MYSDEELIGKSILNELTPESSKRAMALLRKEIEGYKIGKHSPQSLELELVKKSGGTYWVEIRAKLLAEPGNPLKIVGITRDITKRKTAEQHLENQNTKVAEAVADKEKLLKEIKMLPTKTNLYKPGELVAALIHPCLKVIELAGDEFAEPALFL